MFDTEKFIIEIEKRPAIYDVKSTDYSNKQVKAECWMEVGRVMIEEWDEMTTDSRDKAGRDLMKRWKTLRDNFVRDLRGIKKNETGAPASKKKKKKYLFFDQLSFLLPHVKGHDKTTSNTQPPTGNKEERQETETVDDQDVDGANKYLDDNVLNSSIIKRKIRQGRVAKRSHIGKTSAIPSKNVTSLMEKSVTLQKKNTSSDNITDKFGNKAFLTSFVHIMDSLPPLAALDVRMKITEVFMNATMHQPHTEHSITMHTHRSPLITSPRNTPYGSTMDMSSDSSEFCSDTASTNC